ncbi:MAG: hypothetical protein OXH00_00425 [Candidatus Poribacteria bacterium]|nr:hypothetical protein [Candidatus Poribacteria bacterium]
MLEKIVERFCDAPTQYRYLLQTEKIVEKRALEGKNDLSNMSLALTCVFGFIISVLFTFMPFLLSMDTFTFSLIGITMSMMMIGIWMVPYFDILLIPVNYPIIAHTPVPSRTYFLVKLTQILTYTTLLLGSLNLMPAIGGIWVHKGEFSFFRLLFPFVYLPIVFLSGFFTIGVMTTFAGYLTKLYSKRILRNIAQYAQFLFPALFPVTFILLPRLLPDLSKDKLVSVLKWFYALPNGWFAGTVSLALGEIEWHFLILAGLAIVSTLFLVLVPLRSIAKSYTEYLSHLLESGSRQKSKIRVKMPLFGRMFQNRTIRAGLCLCAVYMRRDRNMLRQFFASLGSVIMLVVMLDQGWVLHSFAIGLSPGFSAIFYFVGFSVVGGFIASIRYSEHWKASWMLALAPLSTTHDLWRGVQAVGLLYIVVPCMLLMFCIATVLWGILGIFYILPVSIMLLNFVMLYPKPVSNLPLAEEFVQKQTTGETMIPFLSSLFITGVFIGIQFLTYLLNIWVYYGFYCVTVVGGFIIFIYFLQKNKRTEETVDA